MLFNLGDIQPDKPVVREVDIESQTFESVSGPVQLRDIHAELRFRLDPMGYLVRYNVNARAETDCVRCGQNLTREISVSDLVSLRTKQPEPGHVILSNSEMNVRFLTELKLDLDTFVVELTELEIPAYPRHEEDDAACKGYDADDQETQTKEASPFQALSKLLDK